MFKSIAQSAAWLLRGAAAAALFASAQALAFPVGSGGGPSIGSSDDFGPTTEFGPGWEFGDPTGANPIVIDDDPTAGPWIKQLNHPGDAGGIVPGTPFDIAEYFVYGTGNHWKGWTEIILTPGWAWGNDAFLYNETNDAFAQEWPNGVPGQVNGNMLMFSFGPTYLFPGDEVVIHKQIVCIETDACAEAGFLQIAQYPKVPEPGTLLLLAGGLAGLALRRRRR
jgi:hypothetical protein